MLETKRCRNCNLYNELIKYSPKHFRDTFTGFKFCRWTSLNVSWTVHHKAGKLAITLAYLTFSDSLIARIRCAHNVKKYLPRGEKFHKDEFMVSNLTFEIVIRVVEHITGPGEPSECGQKDQSQHRSPLLAKSLVHLLLNKKSLSCKLCPGSPLFGDVKAEAASSTDGAKCRLVDRERERDGGGENIQAGGGTSPNHCVATSHWSNQQVTLPRSANERSVNEPSSSQSQSQLKKTPLSQPRKWLCIIHECIIVEHRTFFF